MKKIALLLVIQIMLIIQPFSSAFAVGGCGRIITLRPASASSRGGTVIYKSNCNSSGQELSFSAGNHSQAGPAILFTYTSGLFPSGQSITAMNLAGKEIASGFRRSRCTAKFGCGQHERWYFGYGSARSLKAKAPRGMLIKARGTTCIKVNDVYNRREEF